jgi:hypothetical protein
MVVFSFFSLMTRYFYVGVWLGGGKIKVGSKKVQCTLELIDLWEVSNS